MFEPPLDLADARILVTNDDGIHATGLSVLERIAASLSDDVWVVAPEREQSGASHSLTLRQPLRLRRLGERRFAVDGTPTDCVLMAVGHILRDRGVDLVLSGVNRGANLGDDVTYSGTVAAAMEGTLLGMRSIALSQISEPNARTRWETAERHAADVIRRVTAASWPRDVFVNVNFPDVPADEVTGVRVVALGRRKLGEQLEERVDPRGHRYYWIGPMRDEEQGASDTDFAAVNDGAISVTPVQLTATSAAAMASLREALS